MLLEGIEVVLIVIALGGVGHRVGAVVGAAAALVTVIVLGVGAPGAVDAGSPRT